MWSIPWSRVAQMWIGRRRAGNVRVLNIEPFDAKDIERPRSIFYANNTILEQQMRIAPIQIPEMNIDRPLEVLLAQFEEKAAEA